MCVCVCVCACTCGKLCVCVWGGITQFCTWPSSSESAVVRGWAVFPVTQLKVVLTFKTKGRDVCGLLLILWGKPSECHVFFSLPSKSDLKCVVEVSAETIQQVWLNCKGILVTVSPPEKCCSNNTQPFLFFFSFFFFYETTVQLERPTAHRKSFSRVLYFQNDLLL